MHMRRKRVGFLAVILAVMVMVLAAEPVQATSISDLEKQKQEM